MEMQEIEFSCVHLNKSSLEGCPLVSLIINSLDRLIIRPGRLMIENLIAFNRLFIQFSPSINLFIPALRLRAKIIIVHQAALTPK